MDKIQFERIKIEGASRAGHETWFRVHPPGLALDVGRGAPQLAGARDIFLSHGHLGHALGVPFVLSHRTRQELGTTHIHCPVSIVEALGHFVQAASKLENAPYDYKIIGLEPLERVSVGKNLEVEAFAVDHSVAGLGFHLWQTGKQLKAGLTGHPPNVLADLRQQGVEVENDRAVLWLSYCGDTGPEVFDLEPRLFDTKILLIECTFVSRDHLPKAEKFGHMHLEDLSRVGDSFRNQDLVIHHWSTRYNSSTIESSVQ